MMIRYSVPDKWVKYDAVEVAMYLTAAKAAVLSLTMIPYQRSWAERLQVIQLKREVAGTSRIEGADFTENELDAAMEESLEQLHTRSQRQAAASVNAYRWIARLERADIDFENRGIRFQAMKHKTGRRFFVQGFPGNLWAWLDPWRSLRVLPSWPGSSFTKIRKRVYDRAGVRFPHNAGRHSFCTFHVALYGSADRAATLLTHRGSVAVLYDHYRGNATRADAERYFCIVPSAV